MGPITVFDKSFAQSLRILEAVWFDQYSLANVCPMFYAETLADLSKEGLEDLPVATPGDCCVRYFAWDARESTVPEQAAAHLTSLVTSWLSSIHLVPAASR